MLPPNLRLPPHPQQQDTGGKRPGRRRERGEMQLTLRHKQTHKERRKRRAGGEVLSSAYFSSGEEGGGREKQ